MTPTSPVQRATIGSADRLTNAVALVGGVRGALHSGLLEALSRWQPCTSAELATRAHLPVRTVDLTLAALAVAGVVADDGFDRWTLTAPPEAWAQLVGFEDDVCRFVEAGAPTRADGDDRYTGVLPVIGCLHDQAARAVAPSLAGPNLRVLELGAGTAPWSRALLDLDPTITAVAVDLPPVIEQLGRSLADTGLAARIDLLAQDVRSLALTERFDVIVVSGLSRLLAEADNAQLFARCLHLLVPGGRLVICDALAGSADPDGSLALYTLGLAARSRAEALWSAHDYERWLCAAGFAASEVVLTERAGVTVLVAARQSEPSIPPSASPVPGHTRTDTEDLT